jgi:hypothetical protein
VARQDTVKTRAFCAADRWPYHPAAPILEAMDRDPDQASVGPPGRRSELPAPADAEAHRHDAEAHRSPGPASRGDRLLHAVLLVWGAVMGAAVLAGIIGFLVHFFQLQR